MPLMTRPVNVSDFEAIARERMTPSAYDYYAGGAEDEVTLGENREAFRRIALRPRVLVGARRSATRHRTARGCRCPTRSRLAPTAFNKLGHPDGEIAAARAAGTAGTLMCCSTIASTSIEDIAAAATGPLWFQLYVYRDRDVTRDLVRRAEAAGCRAHRPHRRHAAARPPRARHARRLHAAARHRRQQSRALRHAGRAALGAERRASPSTCTTCSTHSLTWESVEWLRSITTLPMLIKGILTAEDAALAVDHGASGIVVSNHGGRQLDGAHGDDRRAAGDRGARRRPRARSSWTAASAAAPTSSRPSRSAPGACSSAAPISGDSPPTAKPASRACSRCCAHELELTMALAGCRSICRNHARARGRNGV